MSTPPMGAPPPPPPPKSPETPPGRPQPPSARARDDALHAEARALLDAHRAGGEAPLHQSLGARVLGELFAGWHSPGLNIAKVLDAGATPFGRPFFVMELVRGTMRTAKWTTDGNAILAGPPWQAWLAPTWQEIAAAEAKER